MNTHKRKIISVVFLFCLGLTFNSFEFLTFMKVCEYPEHGPYFVGFPFIYRTNMTWVNTGSGNYYLLNWLGNIVFWFSVVYLLWIALKKMFKFNGVIPLKGMILGILFSVAYQVTIMNVLDIRYLLVHDVRLDYYDSDIKCNSKLIFFNEVILPQS